MPDIPWFDALPPEVIDLLPQMMPLPLLEAAKVSKSVPSKTVYQRNLDKGTGQSVKSTPRGETRMFEALWSSRTRSWDHYKVGTVVDYPEANPNETAQSMVQKLGAPIVHKYIMDTDLEREYIAAIRAAATAGTILTHDPGDGVFIGYTIEQRKAYIEERIRLMIANGGEVPDTLIIPTGYEQYITPLSNITIGIGASSMTLTANNNYPRVEALINNGVRVEFLENWTGNEGDNRTKSALTELEYDMILLNSKTAKFPALEAFLWNEKAGIIAKADEVEGEAYTFKSYRDAAAGIANYKGIYFVKECFKPA